VYSSVYYLPVGCNFTALWSTSEGFSYENPISHFYTPSCVFSLFFEALTPSTELCIQWTLESETVSYTANRLLALFSENSVIGWVSCDIKRSKETKVQQFTVLYHPHPGLIWMSLAEVSSTTEVDSSQSPHLVGAGSGTDHKSILLFVQC
jgi:hypothetical protein